MYILCVLKILGKSIQFFFPLFHHSGFDRLIILSFILSKKKIWLYVWELTKGSFRCLNHHAFLSTYTSLYIYTNCSCWKKYWDFVNWVNELKKIIDQKKYNVCVAAVRSSVVSACSASESSLIGTKPIRTRTSGRTSCVCWMGVAAAVLVAVLAIILVLEPRTLQRALTLSSHAPRQAGYD